MSAPEIEIIYLENGIKKVIGTIPATEGLITSAGKVLKINTSSIQLEGEIGSKTTIKTDSKNWPTANYISLSDPLLELANFTISPNKAMQATRLLCDHDVSIADVIQSLKITVNMTSLKVDRSDTAISGINSLSNSAKVLAIKSILS